MENDENDLPRSGHFFWKNISPTKITCSVGRRPTEQMIFERFREVSKRSPRVFRKVSERFPRGL